MALHVCSYSFEPVLVPKCFVSKNQPEHCAHRQVSFDSDEMAELVDDLDHRIDERACQCPICTHDVVMSTGDVATTVRRLNDGKRDESGFFSTDHILHGGHALHQAIAELFTRMIRTGATPTPMLDSVVIPIPKNTRKSLNDKKLPRHCLKQPPQQTEASLLHS
ncbi:hypothetical protein CAPTEDRAFT_193975 [Capitella teleta]|uniref:Uncharacterized protein n=1 Tax=Capitella teleta TaxID=283909 RepID=R7US75_CAPTE|nr:hypothetical protein CAPTEDRAFT_193975 [Capitella teleta]|eukprot:ELU06767.1 hypothetical protein CAPTEDRAFT_193975 [Capitella teleta]